MVKKCAVVSTELGLGNDTISKKSLVGNLEARSNRTLATSVFYTIIHLVTKG